MQYVYTIDTSIRTIFVGNTYTTVSTLLLLTFYCSFVHILITTTIAFPIMYQEYQQKASCTMGG